MFADCKGTAASQRAAGSSSCCCCGCCSPACPTASTCTPLPRLHVRNDQLLTQLAAQQPFLNAFGALGFGPYNAANATGYSGLTYQRPAIKRSELAEVRATSDLNVLGRDVVVLTEPSGAPPLAALSTFDPSQCSICSPLLFFTYTRAGAEYEFAAVQPLRRCANDSRWREYILAKAMSLAKDEVCIVPARHIYDRLRPLAHFNGATLEKSAHTVHVATFM